MPKNIRGGKKTKGHRRNWGNFEPIDKLEKGQMFGKINQNNGNHFIILCSDNVKRYAPMNNSIKKGPRLYDNTFVAVSLREFETNQDNCDILGIARPPGNIIEIFKRIDPSRNHTNDVEFGDSDNEFEEVIENKKNTIGSNGISYTDYIGYPMVDSEEEYEYEYEDEEQEIAVKQVKQDTQVKEIKDDKEISDKKEENNKVNNKVNIDKLSSSKQKLLANFMKDDSDNDSDDESESEEDLDDL
jgi:hypothetical protein